MSNKIRILLIEDNVADAGLIRATLQGGRLTFTLRHAENEVEFLHELQDDLPDVILCDHGLPSFDGFKALELARAHCPEVPFIFVTAALGEDVAIASFKNGATDYVLKNRLSQLPHVIERALREVEERDVRRVEQERDELIKELKEALMLVKPLTGMLPVCAACKNIRDQQHGWLLMETYLQTHCDISLTHELCHECETKLSPILAGRGQVYAEFPTGA